MSKVVINLPIRVVTTGKVTLGPKPGTPEFEEEQRVKSEQAAKAR